MPSKSSPVILSAGDAEMLEEAALFYDGTQLHPFNAHRTYAAGAMGVKFLRFTPEEWSSFFKTGIYAEAAMDCAIVVFLCLQPSSVAIRALSQSHAVLEEALEWADAEGLHRYGSPAAASAGVAFGKVITGIFKNLANQELPAGDNELSARRGKKKQ